MDATPTTLEEFLDTDFFKVLAEPARLRLIQLLWREGRSDVGSLAEQMTQERSVVSRHLKILHSADLVTVEKVGRHLFYELKMGAVVEKLELLVARVKLCLGGACAP